jgi:nicotinamidase-related amidase
MSDWRLTPQNSALVVIDVQEKLMNLLDRRAETLAAIQRLLKAATILNLPTLVTTQYTKGLGPLCTEIAELIAGANPMEKTTFSCCGCDEFTSTLKHLHRQRIILCGIETHVCVQQTAIDLMPDYFVYICADATGSRNGHDHTVALQRMRDCGAIITTVEAAVFEMLRQAGTDLFKQILPLFK